ncbi:MAG: hypothetical protein GYA87_02280 [Christensenellaceae bacterium]|nr:hypothetical protein [Christensenellaceae bacterium]
MLKRYHKLFILLIVVLFTFSSCNLIVKDPEVDKSTVIIEIGDNNVTKEEVQTAVDQELFMQSYYYQMQTGMQLDTNDKEIISSIRDIVINNIIKEKVVENKIKENGFDIFSEDKLAEFTENAEKSYQDNYNMIKKELFSDSDLSEDDLKAEIESKMQEFGYPTLEKLIEDNKVNFSKNALRNNIVQDIKVEDSEIKAEYDKNVEAAKLKYTNNISAYGEDVINGTTVYYAPSGYRNVKQILIKISDDHSTKINSLNNQINEKNNQITTATNSLNDIESAIEELSKDENSSNNLEDRTSEVNSLKEIIDNYNIELNNLKNELSTVENEAFSAIDAKLLEVQEKIATGVDFDQLISEYGEDPGMMNSPTKETGYPVCKGSTQYDMSFTTAAMALEKINDISPASKGIYGYYIIKYVSDVPEGSLPLETLSDKIENELLLNKQNEAYENQIEAWVNEANAKIYKNKLD